MLPVPNHKRRAPLAAGVAVLVCAGLALTGCNATKDLPVVGDSSDGPSDASTSAVSDTGPAELHVNVKRGAHDVPVDTLVQVSATEGSLENVAVTSSAGKVPGTVAKNGTSWKASERLEPGVTYTVKATGTGTDGSTSRWNSEFTTQPLTLDQQTYPSVAPLAGQTVGIGMPVIVTFDVPVTDKKSFERNMHVTAQPAQPGTWHWVSDTEAHWRPKEYWKAHSKVHVDVDVNGVDAGNGIYGQEDRQVDFNIGDAHIYRVNTVTDDMRVFSNGNLIRTIPITTGQQPAYTTRSGVKVIIEKFESKDMNSETVGITGADAYNIKGVQYAMRVTYSGEFIHAAPWSVYAQGNSNVSHGCTGMSTENAAWLFNMSQVGDVVEYTGTDRPMEPDNGYGDWNIPFREYRQASALS
ncbi:MAG TPA: Ig-like domain-containing protein [Nocardioides sp.]|nr:Ig-like domain-containing protein [Nocardioides sp.]